MIWLWIGFLALVFVFLALDLGVFNRKAHAIGVREALFWTAVWVFVALMFNVGVYFIYDAHLFGIGRGGDGETLLTGAQAAGKFFTGYIVEKSLSLDNIFVISLIFAYFGVPAIYQHRVLFWGILGALVMRGVMIAIGATFLERVSWSIYVFGGILIVTALKMLFSKHEAIHPERDPVVRLAKAIFPVTTEYHKEHFFVRLDHKLFMTPLFLVLLVVESSDVVFAVDSIPAIFAITNDTFIVFTSNIFAILGLRSLYFALAALITKFRYLKVSLVVILLYIGCKMMCMHLIKANHIEDLMTWVSLGVIIGVMTIGIIASMIFNKQHPDAQQQPNPAAPCVDT